MSADPFCEELAALTAKCAACRPRHGGAESILKSDKESTEMAKKLREYERSYASKVTRETVQRIAAALKRAGIAGVKTEGEPEEISASLVAELKKTMRGGLHEGSAPKLCAAIAGVLNDEFSPGVSVGRNKFIDDSLGPEAICQQVGDWTISFAAGVNTDFLAAHAAVRQKLRELSTLAEVMKRLHSEVRKRADRADDTDADRARDYAQAAEVYERAQGELTRGIAVLNNILKAQIAPQAAELLQALKDASDNHGVIKRLGLTPGTKDFSKSAAAALSSLGTASAIAGRVHKALKAVGLSAAALLDSREYADFVKKLDEKTFAAGPSEVGKALQAAALLRSVYSDRTDADFASQLRALESGADAGVAGAGEWADCSDYTGGAARRRHGGDEEDDDTPKTAVEKAAITAKKERRLIAEDFARRISRGYEGLLSAVNAIAPALGKTIPITERTDALRDAMHRLQTIKGAEQRMEFALIGLQMDAGARQAKDQYLTALRFISRTCDDLLSLAAYRDAAPVLSGLKSAIDAIEKTVDHFSDLVTKKYGGDLDMDDFVKGGDDDAPSLPGVARSGLSLQEAISKFAYSYYVAKVRMNLSRTAGEVDSYGEKYTDLLGDAVAKRIEVLKRLVSDADPAKKISQDEADAKVEFYKTLQAIDLYMKAFTAGITKDPDAIRDIKQIIDGTQTIARWYNEETGNRLCMTFEALGARPLSKIDSHYYEAIKSEVATDLYDPTKDVAGADAAARTAAVSKSKEQLKAALDRYQGLKNLVSAFVLIGDRFGGKELRTQVFMSPSQIFNGLTAFLLKSAYFGKENKAITMVDDVSKHIEIRYFAAAIKAMAAKILVTIGVFDMFERVEPISELTPVRMIVGGADETMPEVIPEAAELYFRLPRLAEFYKSLLGGDMSGAEIQMAMVPEVEGEFSGIIRLVFVLSEGVASGDYSDTDTRTIIREVNQIYEVYRSRAPERPCQAALEAFVMCINRRFGVVKREDIKKYGELARRFQGYGKYEETSYDTTNYSILPGEGEEELQRRAPSDGRALRADGTGTLKDVFEHKRGIDETWGDGAIASISQGAGLRHLLRKFRETLDDKLAVSGSAQTAYSVLIKQASMELQQKNGQDARFAVAARLIRPVSAGRLGVDSGVALMYHETVCLGIDMLYIYRGILVNCKKDLTAATIPFRDYIDMLFILSTTGMVEVRISPDSHGPSVNFSRLRDNIEKLMESVTSYQDMFRGSLSTAVISTADAAIKDLNESLLDEYIRGYKYSTSDKSKSLDALSDSIKNTFVTIVKSLSSAQLAEALHAVVDATKALATKKISADAPGIDRLVMDSRPDKKTTPKTISSDRLDILTVPTGSPTSILHAFNSNLYEYLNTVVDQISNSRVYMSLVSPYANGIASQAVTDPASAIKDWGVTPKGSTDPSPDFMFGEQPTPVFGSLAYVLQRLVTDINPSNQVSDHLIATLTDVPLYMKERLRCALPAYEHIFELLSQRCEFVKQLIERTDLRAKLDANKASSLTAITDMVSAHAYSISTICGEVARELADNPVFMQTREGAIENYKMRYGRLPFMPYSFIGQLISSTSRSATPHMEIYNLMYPNKSLGGAEFKFQYGARALLLRSAPLSWEQIPGAREIIRSYNQMAEKRMAVDESQYLTFVQQVNQTFIYFADVYFYKKFICGGATGYIPSKSHTIPTFASKAVTPVTKIISMVETSNESGDSVSTMTENIKAADGLDRGSKNTSGNRDDELYHNLIDMNIVPINVHAMMRDIPFAPLFNYEYTFDQLAAMMYQETTKKIQGTDLNKMDEPAHKAFLKLLQSPYEPIASTGAYGLPTHIGSTAPIQAIFRGEDDLGMGRPKFLSDQLFNKCLLGSLYLQPDDYSSRGPRAGSITKSMRDAIDTIISAEKTFSVADAMQRRVFDHLQEVKRLLDTATDNASVADENAKKANIAVLSAQTAIKEAQDAVDNDDGSDADRVTRLKATLQAALDVGTAAANASTVANAKQNETENQLKSAKSTHTTANAQNNEEIRKLSTAQAAVEAAKVALAKMPTDKHLTYLVATKDDEKNSPSTVKQVSTTSTSGELAAVGKARFDTVLVRNLFFITNVVRLVRLKLNQELTQSRGLIRSSHFAVAPEVTEYGAGPRRGNEAFGSVKFADEEL